MTEARLTPRSRSPVGEGVVFASMAWCAKLLAEFGHRVELAAALVTVEAANLRIGEDQREQRST